MSFVDLATLALHRRTEMETRIKMLVSKCDHAINDIVRLKAQAQGFVHLLNCEPSELKERFLKCMKQLDEYMYLMTDFNLAVGMLEGRDSVEYAPVHDTSSKILIPKQAPPAFNIIDVLSEPTPSTSTACQNLCPVEKPKKKRVPKEEQTLIMFSSASTSAESVPVKSEIVIKEEKEVQCKITEGVDKVTLTEELEVTADTYNLPAQTMLQTDQVYPALIMNVDWPDFWVITANPDEVYNITTELTKYYKANPVELSVKEVETLTYCAFYDADSDCYYRGLFLRLIEEEGTEGQADTSPTPVAEVYLVDTGEKRTAACEGANIQPLIARYCDKPPYARCCHLAGVDLMSEQNKVLTTKQEEFMKQYIGNMCSIEVDDNTSESLGVYVILSENEVLNALMIQQGLALSTDNPSQTQSAAISKQGPPELAGLSDCELDMSKCPEYEDPVEAVTGYSCRDDADICKHYKGGKDKTCFKGARCKKKHIMKHPDGWTLDRVEVLAKCKPVPLPAPGTWHKVHVTYVCHFDRVCVQLVREKQKEEELPSFGVVLPPTSLEALVRDMNSPASRMAYKPLTMTPAPGELVAALYPLDNQWYRARVLSVTRADQNVEIMYVDYGNVVWVKEDAVRVLEARHAALPLQAVRCALAGVSARSHDSRQWADAKHQLSRMVLDRTLDAHVVARDYDEVTVELFDEDGYNIAEQLAALNLVVLREYEVEDDTQVKQKLVAV